MIWVYFTFYILLQPIGQVLQKIGLRSTPINASSPTSLIQAITNPMVFLGVALSAIGLVLWLILLSRFDLSYIQPLGALAYIVVAVLAYFLLGEHITLTRGLGIGIIVIGAFLLNSKG